MSLVIYSDGGSRGNPGPSAYAIVVTKDGKVIHEHSEFLGRDSVLGESRGVQSFRGKHFLTRQERESGSSV